MASHYISSTQMGETKTNSSHLVIDAREGFFHAMLSYRVNTDADLITKIHDKLHLLAPHAGKSVSLLNQLQDSSPFPEGFKSDVSTLNSSLHVFLDAYCLKDGMGWEGDGGAKSGGFIGAVRLSPVFVPLFSAVEIVSENTKPKEWRGSVGQMMNLAHQDAQDNVLLELIVARELHLMYKTNIKNSAKKMLAPCSYIFPLFRQDTVWNAASSLPKTASAITNAKAKQVLKDMHIPDEAISEQLRNGSLTVHAVWEFFSKFQGIKLYDRGQERFQVVAAADAIIGVIDEVRNFIVAESKFHDLNMSSSQMYELSDFMLQQNMSNYTPILAIHRICNVFQLAELKQSRANPIVQSIAEYGVRASDKSTLPVELSKIGVVVDAAQSSPLAKPLDSRFRNFIDRDASFVTMLSSSSLFDIILSKKLAVIVLFLFSLYNGILSLIETVLFSTASPRIRSIKTAALMIWIIPLLGCLVAVFHSPRLGRYTIALALLYASIISIVEFAVIVYSTFYNNCVDCSHHSLPSETVASLSNVQKVLIGPTQFIIYTGLFFCVAFKQQLTFPILFLCVFINDVVLNSIIGWSVVFQIANSSIGPFYGPGGWCIVFVALRLLRYIGNTRALSIYNENASDVEDAYTSLCKNEKDKDSLFGRLCASPSSKTEPTQFPCLGIFSRKLCQEQHPERASEIPLEVVTMNVHVSNPNQHSTDQNQCEAEVSLIAQTPANQIAAHTKNSGKFQKIISIQDMFKTERTLQAEVLQRQRSFAKLIRDAEFINDGFQEWVNSWLSDGQDFDAVRKYVYFAPEGIDQCFHNLSCKPTNPASFDGSIKGICIRGPLKHVDRAIAKVSVFLCNSAHFMRIIIASHCNATGVPCIFRQFQEVDGHCQMLYCGGHA